ncbi:glycosyltransferase family 4 protein [Aestuariimicrobium kwangyangense]|uniref:glycosyltransferase family 4 protein n=1 Tax=Aestuariimicrobium kwangyangense TaxID=396389 RepID=UPI0003B79B06|nr:glycosyltransferase family 4 protein [Aestuariimicrobium kwangyangense]
MTQHFPPEGGAHAGRWSWLSRELLAKGHSLDVVVPRWGHHPERQSDTSGLRIREVRALVPGLGLHRRLMNEAVTGAQTLLAALRSSRPDVVLTTVPALTSLPVGWLVAKLRRLPLVVELRDAWPHLFADVEHWNDDGTHELPPPPFSNALTPTLTGWYWGMLRDASAIVTTTESLAQDLRGHGMRQVRVARNIATPDDPLPPVDDHDGLNVLYMGVMGRAQRLAVAIDAAALLKESDTPVRLRIVGRGAHSHSLHTYAARKGVDVEWIDQVPKPETRAHLEWADTVLVCLRRWHGMELTVPSKLYDIMVVQRHVSASLEGETAEIVRQSGAGDVVPPEDPEALARLWRDLAGDRSRLRVGSAARDWVLTHGSALLHAAEVEAACEVASARPGVARGEALGRA